MPIAGHLTKIVFGGHLAGTEAWSCGLHFLDPDGPLNDTAGLKTAIAAWFTSADSYINGLALFEYVKANEINPVTGRYVFSNTTELTFGGIAPANPGNYSPAQLSLAVTLRSSIARGYAHAGRFYPPSAAPGLIADGTTGPVGANFSSAVTAKNMLQAINALTPNGQCVIYSRKGNVANFVTGLQVGSVVDTQRRRRRSLKEVYATQAVGA